MKLQKQWVTLKEVADRWSTLTGETVNVNDVLHFDEVGELRIASLLPCCRSVIEQSDPENRLDSIPNICYPIPYESISNQLRTKGVFRFSRFYTLHPLTFQKQDLCKVLETCDEFSPPKPLEYVTVTIDDLRITRVELERFEQAHGIGKHAPTTAPKAKDKPGRPKDPDALKNRLDELKADAINEAEKLKRERGDTPKIDDVANALAKTDKWSNYVSTTVKPHLRAEWWK